MICSWKSSLQPGSKCQASKQISYFSDDSELCPGALHVLPGVSLSVELDELLYEYHRGVSDCGL